MTSKTSEGRNRGILRRKIHLLFGVIFILLFTWMGMGFPSSLAEYRFLLRLKEFSINKAIEISASELMPGDWVMMCESHGYDEDLYIKEYDKKYPNVGAMQDGAWGLIFINPNGSYTSVSASCGMGVYVKFSGNRCLARDKAVFHRLPKDEWKCARLEAR
jgi:hypothetical protein